MNLSYERVTFSERLCARLREMGFSTLSATKIARKFNSLSSAPPVSQQAVNKWLQGLALPSQEKLLVLAKWLKCSPHWLRYGPDAAPAPEPVVVVPLPPPVDPLSEKIASLAPPARKVVEDLVSLLSANPHGSRRSRKVSRT